MFTRPIITSALLGASLLAPAFAHSTALGAEHDGGETLADARTGKNGRHALVGLLQQSVLVACWI